MFGEKAVVDGTRNYQDSVQVAAKPPNQRSPGFEMPRRAILMNAANHNDWSAPRTQSLLHRAFHRRSLVGMQSAENVLADQFARHVSQACQMRGAGIMPLAVRADHHNQVVDVVHNGPREHFGALLRFLSCFALGDVLELDGRIGVTALLIAHQ